MVEGSGRAVGEGVAEAVMLWFADGAAVDVDEEDAVSVEVAVLLTVAAADADTDPEADAEGATTAGDGARSEGLASGVGAAEASPPVSPVPLPHHSPQPGWRCD